MTIRTFNLKAIPLLGLLFLLKYAIILSMVVRMRHTRAHTGNRRSHHALKGTQLSVDTQTGVPHLRHRMSLENGMYRGRKVIKVSSVKKIEKKQSKAKAKKA